MERPPARSSVVPPPSISSSMAPFDRMSEGRRRRIEGSVVGRDDDIDVDFVAFVQFESADDDDSVGFPSDDDNDGAVGCLGADGDSSAGRTTTLMGACTWGELSNVAWSYAARGACGPGGVAVSMMTNLVGEATRRMIAWRRGDGAAADDILPRDAIQIAWALGTMGSDNGDVGDALVHLIDAIRGHWNDGRESCCPLAGWTCADLMATGDGQRATGDEVDDDGDGTMDDDGDGATGDGATGYDDDGRRRNGIRRRR